MATKKARMKHVRKGAVKRRNSTKKAARGTSKKSAGKSASFQKALPGSVIIESGSTLSPYALGALSVFSAGVQRALRRLAERKVPAVVIENGQRIEAVPIKVGGRYVVTESRGGRSAGRATKIHKRGTRIV